MAQRNGVAALNNLVVQRVVNVATGNSSLVAKGDFNGATYTITVEKTGPFDDDMRVLPNGTIDVKLAFDKSVAA